MHRIHPPAWHLLLVPDEAYLEQVARDLKLKERETGVALEEEGNAGEVVTFAPVLDRKKLAEGREGHHVVCKAKAGQVVGVLSCLGV